MQLTSIAMENQSASVSTFVGATSNDYGSPSDYLKENGSYPPNGIDNQSFSKDNGHSTIVENYLTSTGHVI